ncbi:hypothetical protein GQ457_12G011470 [Hibiscus cannabinus]
MSVAAPPKVGVEVNGHRAEGFSIDGQRQDIEYEGLPNICYKCGKFGHALELCGKSIEAYVPDATDSRDPDVLYGPWMQAPSVPRKGKDLNSSGSRFAALLDGVVADGLSEQFELVGNLLNQAQGVLLPNLDVGSHHQNISELAREKGHAGKLVAKLPAIASRDRVIQVDTSLSLENHVVVHIDSSRGGPKTSVSNAHNQSLGSKNMGVKGGSTGVVKMKGGLKPTIKDHGRDNKAGTTMAIANRVNALEEDSSNFDSKLDKLLVGKMDIDE